MCIVIGSYIREILVVIPKILCTPVILYQRRNGEERETQHPHQQKYEHPNVFREALVMIGLYRIESSFLEKRDTVNFGVNRNAMIAILERYGYADSRPLPSDVFENIHCDRKYLLARH
jgi:hypothetical protein